MKTNIVMPNSAPARATRAGGFRSSKSIMDASNRAAGAGHVRTRTHLGRVDFPHATCGRSGHVARCREGATCPERHRRLIADDLRHQVTRIVGVGGLAGGRTSRRSGPGRIAA